MWVTVLVVGFFTLVGLSRAGSILFWAVRDEPRVGAAPGASPRILLASCALFSATLLMSVLAGPIKRDTDATAAQVRGPVGPCASGVGRP